MKVYEHSDEVIAKRKPQLEGKRIMILSGIWTMPGSQYDFYAILHLQTAGDADGTINWHANRMHGVRESYSAVEQVSGQVLEQHANLTGYETGPMLYPDHYRINLSGDSSYGSFHGTSETCNKDWLGRMRGTYMFLKQG